MSQTHTTEQWRSQVHEQEGSARPSIDITFASPDYTPDLSRVPTVEYDVTTQDGLKPMTSRGHMGDALESLASAITNASYAEPAEDTYELRPTLSHRAGRKPSPLPTERRLSYLDEEAGSPTQPITQGVPAEIGSLTKEIIFVLVCSCGQLLFAFNQGNVNVNQQAFKHALALQSTELPWLNGAFLVALGLSVILAGSLTDLAPPKLVVIGAVAWLSIWNIIGAFTLVPDLSALFFFMRAMQGLAVGVLVSGSMSILGRAPFGFWLGALQGGALSAHLPWIFGSNAMISVLLCVAAYFTIPNLRPTADVVGSEAPGLRNFDFKGALCAVVGCICLLFGLTQGSVAHWAPYTYALIIVGVLAIALFFWLENRVARPMIPSKLWSTRGFAPLMAAYFLGFGSFVTWQFYAIQFFLRIQRKAAITVALYLLPNLFMGVLATWIVSRLIHIVPGHHIYIASMLAFALGPAFFLPQKPTTIYWALSMPGIGLATFGPDLSFAAASIFITSNVPRSYQGAAGSLLVTIQNLSSAIMTSIADSIGAKVDLEADGEIGLEGLRAAWWFALAASLVGAAITAVWVRIPKEEEHEHVT
ncbi:hypothetical protein LTR36_009120 [Oleoguttula mirabilis]|uniref:MFS general substrate transporter n=1 Tax=Oleoguttula mirabilis TaxID=1507867 RepID=A0AAV9J6C4_9PEZI|nr:hypothetical protein LTR36_009120 [Oleoguttula mirabilis]